MCPRLALLGDSILDNQPYTDPLPDTTHHLRALLGDGWRVELLAEDGAVIRDVPRQLRRAAGADVGVLSVGGNDATRYISEITRPATSAAETLDRFGRIADDFGRAYEGMVARAVAVVPQLVLCTIYEVRLEPRGLARLARVPIALLCDRIFATARQFELPVLDLRTVCTEDADFTLEIEPSAQGAEKIARAIAAEVRLLAALGEMEPRRG